MNINDLKQLLIDQRKAFLRKEKLIDREIQESYKDFTRAKQIIAITGVRRSGKSSFLKLTARYLLKIKNIDKRQIFYVNFEDELFVNFKTEDFNALLSAYYEVSQIKKEKIYCFFDEIQNVKYWEKWVRKLYDMSGFKIFVTGSNSSLLSSEIASALTGRNYPLEIFPFSFREYLIYKNITIPHNIDTLTTKEKSFYKKHLDAYLLNGGFPESIDNKLDILEEYYKNIIYKDIIVRYGIKNINEFRSAALYLMSNISSLMSYRGIAKVIEGLDSSMTAKNYLGYLENTYLLFTVRKLEPSVRKQLMNPFKIYSIDNGMMKSVAFSVSRNFNKLYENAVYLNLRRTKGIEIYYYKGNFENDFVTIKNSKAIQVIQVSYNIQNKKTEEREIRGIVEALEKLKMKKGYIINDYLDKEVVVDNKKLHYIPLWKWLLDKNKLSFTASVR